MQQNQWNQAQFQVISVEMPIISIFTHTSSYLISVLHGLW